MGEAGGAQLRVDTSRLTQLADELRRYTDSAMRPEAQAAGGAFGTGVPFGEASASGDVFVAKHHYHQNLVRVTETLRGYAREVEALSAKAREAAGGYADADAAAAARTTSAAAGLPGGGAPGATAPFIGPPAPTVPPGFIGPVAPGTVRAAEPTQRFADVASWCTNWSAYDVPALWRMVEPDNVCEGWNHVNAWQRVSTAVNDQIRTLTARRQEFAEAWSAEGSAAAAALLGRLDRLVVSMRQTAAAAAATGRAMEGINQALSDAQRDLRVYRDEYQSKSNDLMLRQLDGAEDELNEQARQRIARAEQEVRAAAGQLAPIPIFDFDPTVEVDPPDRGGGGAAPSPPAVPPVRHFPPAPTPGVPPVLPEGTQWVSPVSGGSGGPHLTAVTPPISLPSVVPTPTVPGIPVTGPGPAPAPGGLPVGGGPTGWSPPGLIPTPAPAAPRGGTPNGTTQRRMPFGGGTPQAARGLPAGGIIGPTSMTPPPGRPAAGGRGGAPGIGGLGAMAPNAGRGRPAPGADGSGGDPDNPWEVAEGVAPVIEPGRQRHRHDPGPGVIGMDL